MKNYNAIRVIKGYGVYYILLGSSVPVKNNLYPGQHKLYLHRLDGPAFIAIKDGNFYMSNKRYNHYWVDNKYFTKEDYKMYSNWYKIYEKL